MACNAPVLCLVRLFGRNAQHLAWIDYQGDSMVYFASKFLRSRAPLPNVLGRNRPKRVTSFNRVEGAVALAAVHSSSNRATPSTFPTSARMTFSSSSGCSLPDTLTCRPRQRCRAVGINKARSFHSLKRAPVTSVSFSRRQILSSSVFRNSTNHVALLSGVHSGYEFSTSQVFHKVFLCGHRARR